jgi:hypothetical protein
MYNKVFYTEGTNHLARMIVPDGLMQFYVADNDDTRDMVRGTRIIVKGEIFNIKDAVEYDEMLLLIKLTHGLPVELENPNPVIARLDRIKKKMNSKNGI